MLYRSSLSFEKTLLTLAIALFPLYVFPSGGVQPSHLIFLLLSLSAIGRHGVPKISLLPLLVGITIYSLFIEAMYGAIAGDMRYLANPAFFFFNLILVAGVYQVVWMHGLSSLKFGILIALTIAMASVHLKGLDLQEIDQFGRSTGTFNNPNQLGYFSVCILSLSYLLYIEKKISFFFMLLFVCSSTFLSIASLSKAAIISNIAVLLFTLRPAGKGALPTLTRIALPFVAIVGVGYLISTGKLENFLFFERIINMGNEQDSSLVSRGYTAFLEGNAFQLIFGLGSLEVYNLIGHEVHSTFASMWNVYGLIGGIFIFLIFYKWAKDIFDYAGLKSAVIIVTPSALYGITHNGIRFSIFWLLVAASLGVAARRRHSNLLTKTTNEIAFR